MVEGALVEVKGALHHADPAVRAAARFQRGRLEQLAQFCRAGLNLLRVLLDSARVDLAPLKLLSEALGSRSRGPVHSRPDDG